MQLSECLLSKWYEIVATVIGWKEGMFSLTIGKNVNENKHHEK